MNLLRKKKYGTFVRSNNKQNDEANEEREKETRNGKRESAKGTEKQSERSEIKYAKCIRQIRMQAVWCARCCVCFKEVSYVVHILHETK